MKCRSVLIRTKRILHFRIKRQIVIQRSDEYTFNAYKEVASKNEYTNNNRSNVSYGLSGSPGNYTFTLKITYRETKEQTEYVMKQAKAIVSSITQAGMDDHEK